MCLCVLVNYCVYNTYCISAGSTAVGWMAVKGNKAEGTDVHSKTASTIGITRDQAKVCGVQ